MSLFSFKKQGPIAGQSFDNDLEMAVFGKIYRQRSLRREELIGAGLTVTNAQDRNDEPESINGAVSKLVARHLVKVIPGVINDFDTLVVTAEGFRLADHVDL